MQTAVAVRTRNAKEREREAHYDNRTQARELFNKIKNHLINLTVTHAASPPPPPWNAGGEEGKKTSGPRRTTLLRSHFCRLVFVSFSRIDEQLFCWSDSKLSV